MKRKILVGAVIAAFLVAFAPFGKAVADGGASTRNILLGIGAAAGTLLIINHNKQVHEKYAQDAATQAALASQRDNAEAAYKAEVKAYNNQVAVTDNLKKEVALKDQMIADQSTIIKQQKTQLAQMGLSAQPVAVAPVRAPASNAAPSTTAMAHGPTSEMISYGWGTL
ncbi:MAG TPA: hypothetical protein VEJ41_03345 [Candidatus Acidoferrales bacterium]|nr:hypothetical protein [Candidatus Acidoferrales bacterium]